MSDKVASLLIGAVFLVVVFVSYTLRERLAGALCGFMFPAVSGPERAHREVRLQRLLRIFLGIYLPALTVILMLLAALR